MGLGFSMNGLENAIEDVVYDTWKRFGSAMTYVEIGVGYGGTLAGVAQMLDACPAPRIWRAVGVELPQGYSFCESEVMRAAQTKHLSLKFVETFPSTVSPRWGEITVYLCDAQKFFPLYWKDLISLALIDGCHGRACVQTDFHNIKRFIQPGGIVMFHDFGLEQVGQPQRHCETLNVRGACEELFAENDQWSFVAEWVGDKAKSGANMGVYRKTDK